MRRQNGTGTIYWDRSSRCDRRRTMRERNRWRAEIVIAGKRHRARFRDFCEAEVWLNGMVAEAELLRSQKGETMARLAARAIDRETGSAKPVHGRSV